MSANIKFKIVESDGKDVGSWRPSAFIDSLRKAFGVFPCELGPRDVPKLQGMAAASDDRDALSFQALIEEIGECNHIRVWADY